MFLILMLNVVSFSKTQSFRVGDKIPLVFFTFLSFIVHPHHVVLTCFIRSCSLYGVFPFVRLGLDDALVWWPGFCFVFESFLCPYYAGWTNSYLADKKLDQEHNKSLVYSPLTCWKQDRDFLSLPVLLPETKFSPFPIRDGKNMSDFSFLFIYIFFIFIDITQHLISKAAIFL